MKIFPLCDTFEVEHIFIEIISKNLDENNKKKEKLNKEIKGFCDKLGIGSFKF